jgi:hypothetical protein
VGVALDLAGTKGQHRLGPVERLDLGLLVDGEHDRSLGRYEIEPDDVADLGHEVGVGAELERLRPMGLETHRSPDPPNRRLAHAQAFGQSAGAPVGGARGRWFKGPRDHSVTVLPRVRRRTPRAGLVGQAGQAVTVELGAPQEHGHGRDAELSRDGPIGHALSSAQDDARALGDSLLRRPRSSERPEHLEIRLLAPPPAAALDDWPCRTA